MPEAESDHYANLGSAEDIGTSSAVLAGAKQLAIELSSSVAIALIPDPFKTLASVAIPAVVAAGSQAIQNVLGVIHSDRPKIRALATAYVALVDIEGRVRDGEHRRNDDFYTPTNGRAPGEELFEGALQIAARTYEERKLKVLANVLANTDLDQQVSGHEAQFALHIIDRLTFAQLCLLAHCSNNTPRPEDPIPDGPQFLVGQLEVLADEGLVGLRQDDGGVAHYATVFNGGTFRKGLGRVTVTDKGARLADLLGLNGLASDPGSKAIWNELLAGH